MSHEIRTPMNAVLGLADMALREDMTPLAKAYLHQIKASGKNLLVIINDILDFSKVESGKMEIIEDNYEPYSLCNDLSGIVISRIREKNIEFIMDVSPELPQKMYGDNVRIHQVILNLLTNSVKYTEQGRVKLTITPKEQTDYSVILCVSVSDTGIGIKPEDQEKIFNSFQQVDSKRNRNIEMGTVEHGKKLGRKLGMPTVNLIPPAGKLLPPNGVYYSQVIVRGEKYNAISNIGCKPTVSVEKVVGIESFLYDFDRDIYGETIEVQLLAFKRPEMRFENVEQLKVQMEADIAEGRKFH